MEIEKANVATVVPDIQYLAAEQDNLTYNQQISKYGSNNREFNRIDRDLLLQVKSEIAEVKQLVNTLLKNMDEANTPMRSNS